MNLKVDASKTDKHGKSALICTVKNKHLLCVDALLRFGEKINVKWKDSYELTARNYSDKESDIRKLLN